ncbi:MAG: iron ABC transporter permease [Candidatus Omnitrophica bacterium]|nr:iron ABC transporter permease [Candidatus Omnitrophota bacterium]
MSVDYAKTLSLFALALIAAVFLSLALGSVPVPLTSLFKPEMRGLLALRAGRVLLTVSAGASLAVVGAILQGLLKNPLADPYVLGISSGSGLGAVIAIMLGFNISVLGDISIPLSAFIFGLCSIVFVYFLSKKGSRVGAEDLLLSGVIVTSMLSGVIMYIVSATEREGLHSALWWLLGNTQVYDLRLLSVVSAVSLSGMIVSIMMARHLNIMSIGEEEAITMGLDVEKIKALFFIVSSIMTAVVVSVCGMIGFVGLIVPHIVRKITGPDHRKLIPASALCGSVYLVLCDIAARRLAYPMELPIGIITAICGGPFFILLLKRSKVPD